MRRSQGYRAKNEGKSIGAFSQKKKKLGRNQRGVKLSGWSPEFQENWDGFTIDFQ